MLRQCFKLQWFPCAMLVHTCHFNSILVGLMYVSDERVLNTTALNRVFVLACFVKLLRYKIFPPK